MNARFAIPLVLMFSFGFAGQSHGEDKIKDQVVGKWKVVSSSKKEEIKELSNLGLAMTFEFTAKGEATITIISTKPESAEIAKLADGEFQKKAGKITYTVDETGERKFKSTGEIVKSDAKSKITVKGDKMTMTDPDGEKVEMERVKK
jgi:hypothetical protein